ncbi:helix-turn-helix domain-containing protein [Rhodococcus sp. BH2-1]|nr:helix-turn-helix domain-containing protein [Rhodococcus sp. BH2-1]
MGSSVSPESAFGQLVRRERERFGWSQAELAERLTAELAPTGVKAHPTTIAKIEARDAEKPRAIRLDEAAALARIFGRSIDDMLQIRHGLPIGVAVRQVRGSAMQMRRTIRMESSELNKALDQLSEIDLPMDRPLATWDEEQLQALVLVFTLPEAFVEVRELIEAITRTLELSSSDSEVLIPHLEAIVGEGNDGPA